MEINEMMDSSNIVSYVREALAPIKGGITKQGMYKIVMYQVAEDIYKLVVYKKEVIEDNEEEDVKNWLRVDAIHNLSESEARKEFTNQKKEYELIEKGEKPSNTSVKTNGVSVNVTVNVNKD